MKKNKVGDIIRINYGKPPKKISVRLISAIAGGDQIAIDRKGRLYTTWWECNAGESGKPPIGQRHWRRYEHGIYYLHRGLIAAMASTKGLKIPTLEQLQEFCRAKQAEISLFSGKADLPKLEAMTGQFKDLHDFLKGKIRQPLVRSRDQLSFILLLRDSLGRVNIGVLSARLSTIDRLFIGELHHLLGWLPHYAARLEAVGNLQADIQRQVTGIFRSLRAMLSHEAFKSGRTKAAQVKGISAALRQIIEIMESLKKIQPFTAWAELCLADLTQAEWQIGISDFVHALAKIHCVENSCQLRIAGFDLEELIAKMSFDLIMRQEDALAYADSIDRIVERILPVSEHGFVRRVKGSIITLIYQARHELTNDSSAPKYARAKKLLKEAAALI